MATTQLLFQMAERAGFPVGSGSGNPPIQLSEADTTYLRYGPGWSVQSSAAYYDGAGMYSSDPGAFVELTCPVGYTRIVFEGIAIPSGASFSATVNGVQVGTGTQTNGVNGFGIHYEFTGLLNGDICRLTRTGPEYLFVDRVTLYAS